MRKIRWSLGSWTDAHTADSQADANAPKKLSGEAEVLEAEPRSPDGMDEGKAKGRLGTALALARNVPVQGNSSRGLTTNRLKATAPRQRILFTLFRSSPGPFHLPSSVSPFHFGERLWLWPLSSSGASPETQCRDNRLQMHLPPQRRRRRRRRRRWRRQRRRRRCSARCIGDVSRRITRGRSSARLPREPQALLPGSRGRAAACLSHEISRWKCHAKWPPLRFNVH